MDEDPVRLEIPLDPGSNFANLMYHICTLKTVLSIIIIVIWLLFAVTANSCRLARFRGPPATMLEPTWLHHEQREVIHEVLDGRYG